VRSYPSQVISQCIEINNIVVPLFPFRCTLAADGTEQYIAEKSQQIGVIRAIHQLDGYLAYDPRKRGYLFDIAIIEVYPHFKLNEYINPAKLPTARTPSGTNLIVSGWGYTSFGKLNTNIKFNITQVWCWLFSHMYFTNNMIKRLIFRWQSFLQTKTAAHPIS
jgi:Trypsin